MVTERAQQRPLRDWMGRGAAFGNHTPTPFLCSSQDSSSAASAAQKDHYWGRASVHFGTWKGVLHGADAPWLDPCDEHRDEGGAACATTLGASARPTRRTGFRQDESGIALSEALITFPIVLLVFAALVEFGYAMSQWNQTVKALQYGARLAAVSDPLTSNFATVFPTSAANPVNNGTATPNDATVSSTCGPNLANCNVAALNRIVYGSSAATECQSLGTAGIRPAICHANPEIERDNIAITYQRSGLGYWGRPEGPVVTMRFEVRNVTFDLPLLGGLLGLDTITIPAHPVTITTEDLRTCSTC
ncbi:hypothetical protein J2Z31_004023 [Sinorhizobium kostiense]|uniref:TadE-like domain-containing protein n=1 Tax=Sinorhizobium kostiense TaxID=76747 RepID=A0ABS4R3P4_9HYPH|nr:hypothetical protein [Sinorhizobium kostiense]